MSTREKNKLQVKDRENSIFSIDRAAVFNDKVESFHELKSSIFLKNYRKAAGIIKEIIKASEVLGNVNNMITFTGNRGSGKTTLLRSFASSLKEDSIKKVQIKEYEDICEYRFDVLETMDLKDNFGDNIVSHILYNFYRSFEDKEVNKEDEEYKEIERRFNSLFNIADYSMVDNKKKIDLKKEITELIYIYLDYFNEDYLVISLDNINNDIEKVERYFKNKKVIILNTIDKSILESKNFKDYKLGYINSYIYIREMDFYNCSINIDESYFSNIDFAKGNSIYDQLREFFKLKFNYYITDYESFKAIVSDNLKEFINFIIFINDMALEKDKIEIIRFLESNIINKLSESKYETILKGILTSNLEDMNKYVFIKISELLSEKMSRGHLKIEIEKTISYIMEYKYMIKENKVSLGNIITIIDFLRMYIEDEEEKLFIELLKFIYTIKLLFEFHINKDKVINSLGLDYFGEYLGMRYKDNKFTNLIEINSRKSAEDIKYYFGNRKNIFNSVLQPSEDNKNIYSYLVSDSSNEFFEESLYKQRYYNLKNLNFISYSIINNHKENDSLFFCILNINCWMDILDKLSEKLQESEAKKKNYIIITMEYLNDIIKDINFDKKDCDFNFKDIESEGFIDSLEVEFLQNLNNDLARAEYLYTYR
ncbi:hypothetical protein SAMN04487886_106516 [Clostridium sp. DSM 8431]|uniref:hypothetical protein n=1 Tax=Clostridium sp. DSM 8431 TaxID=1761781 RepID=UPI0008E105EC|nr:hypothetical protein [Clostridium sp. DSM 8431]SFU58330.1 hypothetical protein SAMN04487886_106516 [Clostridium sp. DSM 8431]